MASPPITIGEITDVPAPQSAINAQFMQEVAHRITHRFATVAQMNAWAAGNGSLAFSADTKQHYARIDGAWVALALASAGFALGVLNRFYGPTSQSIGTTPTALTGMSITFTADPTRWYRTTVMIPAIQSSAVGWQVSGIDNGSGALLRQETIYAGANENGAHFLELIESGLSGSVTRRAVAQVNTGTGALIGSPAQWLAHIAVSDEGAV